MNYELKRRVVELKPTVLFGTTPTHLEIHVVITLCTWCYRKPLFQQNLYKTSTGLVNFSSGLSKCMGSLGPLNGRHEYEKGSPASQKKLPCCFANNEQQAIRTKKRSTFSRSPSLGPSTSWDRWGHCENGCGKATTEGALLQTPCVTEYYYFQHLYLLEFVYWDDLKVKQLLKVTSQFSVTCQKNISK